MQAKKQRRKGGMNDNFLYIILVVLGGVIYFKFKSGFDIFWGNHKYLVFVVSYGFLTILGFHIIFYVYGKIVAKKNSTGVISKESSATFLGNLLKDKKPVYLRQEFRRGHTQIIGTTSAGKTESVILPLVIKDIENGSGVLIIDGKADKSFLDKLHAYTCKHNRKKDFRLFSIASLENSWSFNPLAIGSHREIVERAFSIFTFENEYYKSVQYKIFSNLVEIILDAQKTPSFYLVQELLNDMQKLRVFQKHAKSEKLKNDLESYIGLKKDERERIVSGIDAQITPFTTGQMAPLFSSQGHVFNLTEAMEKNQIIYFQLPTMLSQYIGEKMGRMVLQCLQSAVARRQLGLNKKDKNNFFGCYLDDFQDYIYEGFGSLLNKSRSANVGLTFSHQAMGDLDKVSPAFSNIVFTNTNIKIVMRSNDPETCDLFSKSFGTKTIEKLTQRQDNTLIGSKKTGVGSLREAEQYVFHPNLIKNQPRGQGILSIAHPHGVFTQQVKFCMRPNLKPMSLRKVKKSNPVTSTDDLQLSPKVEQYK